MNRRFFVMQGSCIILAATFRGRSTYNGSGQATWCKSGLAKGEMVMEEMAKNNELQDNKREQREEDLSYLLDSINTEINDMADLVLQDESTMETMFRSDNGDSAELDSELSEEEDLQLDSETAEDSSNPSNEIQPKEEGAKIERDTSVDDKDEDENMLVEK